MLFTKIDSIRSHFIELEARVRRALYIGDALQFYRMKNKNNKSVTAVGNGEDSLFTWRWEIIWMQLNVMTIDCITFGIEAFPVVLVPAEREKSSDGERNMPRYT